MEEVITFREIDVSRDSSAIREYGIQVTPTVIILDAAGREVETFEGVPEESELRRAIDEAVNP